MKRTRDTISIFYGCVCANCAHFYQHYVRYPNGEYHSIHIGHCAYPRLKDRYITETCANFKEGERAAYAKHMDEFYQMYPDRRPMAEAK